MSLKRNIEIAPHVVEIVGRLQNAGYETLLVGGAVRDLLVGRSPKDYDLSTAATPEQIRRVFGKRRARIIGKRFRLVHLYNGNEIIEISTFRKAPQTTGEGEMLPVDNDFGTAVEDAWRRDFTVNSIFFDPADGRIIDHTGMGIEDLEAGIVRTVGNPPERFNEDPVRILRALKLVGQYGFTLEPSTASALSAALPLILQCSHSRLALEFEKIIKGPYSDGIFRAFKEYGFLEYYLPSLNELWGSPECEYALELLAERNARLTSGKYRESISLSIAALALPFVAARLSEGPESVRMKMWSYRFGIEKEIREIVAELLSPHSFPRRIIASTIGMLMLQPSMFAMKRKDKVLLNKRYRHARELMTIQNNVAPRNDELEEFWPLHGTRGGTARKRGGNGRRARGPRRGGVRRD